MKRFKLTSVSMDGMTFDMAKIGDNKIHSLTDIGYRVNSANNPTQCPGNLKYWESLPPELNSMVLSHAYNGAADIFYEHSFSKGWQDSTENQSTTPLSVTTSQHFAQLFTSRSFFELALPLIATSTRVDIRGFLIKDVREAFKEFPQWHQIFEAVLDCSRITKLYSTDNYGLLHQHIDNCKHFKNLKIIELDTIECYYWYKPGSRRSKVRSPHRLSVEMTGQGHVDLGTNWKSRLEIAWNKYIQGLMKDEEPYPFSFGDHHIHWYEHRKRLSSVVSENCKAYKLVTIFPAIRWGNRTAEVLSPAIVCRIDVHDLTFGGVTKSSRSTHYSDNGLRQG